MKYNQKKCFGMQRKALSKHKNSWLNIPNHIKNILTKKILTKFPKLFFAMFAISGKIVQSNVKGIETYDLSFASTETKFKNPITQTQNNIAIFGFFHKKMILSFWLFLK